MNVGKIGAAIGKIGTKASAKKQTADFVQMYKKNPEVAMNTLFKELDDTFEKTNKSVQKLLAEAEKIMRQ